jgi:hypothetical protein
MTATTFAGSAQARRVYAPRAPSKRLRQGLVLSAVGAAAVGGLLITDGAAAAEAVARAGAGLTQLLRGMALIKTLMAAGALAAVLWRLESPVGPGRLTAYILMCAAMAAGPGLIWTVKNVGAGAALLHIGLIGTLVVLWRDPETARRMSAVVVSRRRDAT